MTFRCVKCDKELNLNVTNGKVKKGCPITIICGCGCHNSVVRKKSGKIILVAKKIKDKK